MTEQGTLVAWWERGKEQASDGTMIPGGFPRECFFCCLLLTDEVVGGWGCGSVVSAHLVYIHEDLASIPKSQH